MIPYLSFISLGVIAALVFALNSWIDISATAAHYTSELGFFMAHEPWVLAFYLGVPFLDIAIISTLVSYLFYTTTVTAGNLDLMIVRFRGFLFVLLSYAMGPGLVINFILKEHWGRARPYATTLFGGESQFTPAFWISDQCTTNCSFVAGHPSTFFFLSAFAFLVPRPIHKILILCASLILGAVAGYGRILQGAHFLSDVVFSGFFTILTVWTLWLGIYRLNVLEHCMKKKYWVAATLITGLIALGMLSWDKQIATFCDVLGFKDYAWIHWVSRTGLTLPHILFFGFATLVLGWLYIKTDNPWYLALRQKFVFILFSLGIAGGIVDVLKPLIGRFRPKLFLEQGLYGFDPIAFKAIHWSFPSGHSATIFALAGALNVLFPRPVLWYGYACFVAITRILLTEHYFSDVIAGAAIGVISPLLLQSDFAKTIIKMILERKEIQKWRTTLKF